uniref:Hypotheticial protein n=1 Tax=Schistosoma japonicum TaxID=6182 RepID=C1LQ65_SCHJA|nr:hypotheticial protein [Schistosoma japonicum]
MLGRAGFRGVLSVVTELKLFVPQLRSSLLAIQIGNFSAT